MGPRSGRSKSTITKMTRLNSTACAKDYAVAPRRVRSPRIPSRRWRQRTAAIGPPRARDSRARPRASPRCRMHRVKTNPLGPHPGRSGFHIQSDRYLVAESTAIQRLGLNFDRVYQRAVNICSDCRQGYQRLPRAARAASRISRPSLTRGSNHLTNPAVNPPSARVRSTASVLTIQNSLLPS